MLIREAAVDMDRADISPTFEDIFRANYSRIARLICRVVGNPARAEELASEVFWKLHRKPPAHSTNVEGWLCRTALNLALDALRSDTRRSKYESVFPPGAAAPDPERAMQQAEEASRVRSVLAALKREQSELLVLRSHEYSYAEIAETLNLHAASVGTLLARAEAAFRKEYVTRYGER